MSTPRIAEVTRNTRETRITVRINLDGTGQSKLQTGIGFFDHMLDQIARHGLIDLDVHCEGDLHIDGHHTVEDVGITLGLAVAKAVGDKAGLTRLYPQAPGALETMAERQEQLLATLEGAPAGGDTEVASGIEHVDTESAGAGAAAAPTPASFAGRRLRDSIARLRK